jgi:hypothetical protein
VERVLRNLVESRIVVKENLSYNLVHDYFSPLIAIATQESQDRRETANLLLRRYINQSRSNDRLRIPFLDLLAIQRFSSRTIRQEPGAYRLLKASWCHAVMHVVTPVTALVFLPLVVCYGLLSYSYYLSTVPGARKGDGTQIVVRTGMPILRVLPGFDNVAVVTDYGMKDIDVENQEALDTLPRGEISGFWSKPAGYQTWGDQIASRLPPLESSGNYRLLGDWQRAQEKLKPLKIEQRNAPAYWGALGLIEQPESHGTLFQPIAENLKMEGMDRIRSQQAVALLRLNGAAALDKSSIPLIKLLNDFSKEATKDTDKPEWRYRVGAPYLQAIKASILGFPEGVSENAVDSALSILVDRNIDIFVRMDFISDLELMASTNEKAARKVFVGMIRAMTSPAYMAEIEEEGSSWFEQRIFAALNNVGRANPPLVTKESIKPLAELIADPRNDIKKYYYHVISYLGLVAANKAPIDPVAILSIKSKVAQLLGTKDGSGAAKGISTAIALLAFANGSLSSTEMIAQSHAYMRELEALETGSFPPEGRYVATIALDLLDWQLGTELRQGESRYLATHGMNMFLKHGESDDPGALKLTSFLNKVRAISGEPVVAAQIEKLFNMAMEDTVVGRRGLAANTLLAVSRQVPEYIVRLEDKITKVVEDDPLGRRSQDRVRATADAALSVAKYKILLRESGAEEKLWKLLMSDNSPVQRRQGEIGLYLYALDKPPARAKVLAEAQRIAQSDQPHHRMAANRLREMLRVAQILEGAKQDLRRTSLAKGQLQFIATTYGNVPSAEHLRIAALIALEEL